MAVVESPFSLANLNATSRVRYIDEDLETMAPMTVPFLNLVGINGTPVTNPKVEWQEETLMADTSTIASGLAADPAATALTVATGDGVLFQVGSILQIESEFVYVSARTGDALTIVRAIGGTSGATHADSTAIELLSIAVDDTDSSPAVNTVGLDTPFNYIQLFDASFQVTWVQSHTKVHGMPEGDLAHQLSIKEKELFIKLEKQAIRGGRSLYGTPTGAPYLMGGLDFFLSAYTAKPDGSASYAADLNGAQLTEKDINDALAYLSKRVGQDAMPMTMLVNTWNARRINDMFAPYHRSQRAERTGGVVVDQIDTLWGPVDVVPMIRVPEDKVYFVNLDFISIHPYEGLAMGDYELSTQGAQYKRMLYGVYTMKVKNTRAMGRVIDTATG